MKNCYLHLDGQKILNFITDSWETEAKIVRISIEILVLMVGIPVNMLHIDASILLNYGFIMIDLVAITKIAIL